MKVPFREQETEHMCGPATLQMMFEFFGKHETQEKLATLLLSDPVFGTSHNAIMKCARIYGFRCHPKIRATVSDIRNLLALNEPVIINYFDTEDRTGHYAIVVNATNTELILNDPANGKDFKMKISDFEKNWHNTTGLSKRWLLTLSLKSIPMRRRSRKPSKLLS